MLGEPGQGRDQGVHEAGAEARRRPRLELAQVHVEPDDGEMGVQARADVDRAVDDPHGALRGRRVSPGRGSPARGRPSGVRGRRWPRW